MPEEFHLSLPLSMSIARSLGRSEPLKMEIKVFTDSLTGSDLDDRVEARVAEIGSYSTQLTDIVKARDRVAEGIYRIRVNKVENYYSTELHIEKQGTYLSLASLSRQNNLDQVEREQITFANSIRSVSKDSGKHSDFCAGKIAIEGVNTSEYGIYHFRSRKNPDLLLEIMVDSYAPDDQESLLQRVNGANSLLRFLSQRPKVLRQSERIVAGMKVQEWLSVTNNKSEKQYNFALETHGRDKTGPKAPKIHLELKSGQYDLSGKQKNSLDDASAIALWEEIVRSIVLR
nr:T6SS immunity protein Tli4 family protein [Pseudoduganella buxea]